MKTDFNTTPYRFSHGRDPRGFGSWAFSTDRAGRDNVRFAPASTYAAAKKWARDAFPGAAVLYVLP